MGACGDTSASVIRGWECSKGGSLGDDDLPPKKEGGGLGNWDVRGFEEGVLRSG